MTVGSITAEKKLFLLGTLILFFNFHSSWGGGRRKYSQCVCVCVCQHDNTALPIFAKKSFIFSPYPQSYLQILNNWCLYAKVASFFFP